MTKQREKNVGELPGMKKAIHPILKINGILIVLPVHKDSASIRDTKQPDSQPTNLGQVVKKLATQLIDPKSLETFVAWILLP